MLNENPDKEGRSDSSSMSLKELLDNASVPAAAVGWRKEGKFGYVAEGMADTSVKSSVTPETLFQAASLSKPVSAAIVLDLAEKGEWELDKPLAEIAAFGSPAIQQHKYYHKLTTRMILAQCSGLANFSEGIKEEFIAEPGTKFTYSGVAYEFLKKVMAEVLKKNWEEIAQDFFRKVGMVSSTFKEPCGGRFKDKTVAQGHDASGSPGQVVPPIGAVEVPAGSLFTTARDYIQFLQYCFANEFLRSKFFVPYIQLDKNDLKKTPDVDKITWGQGMGIVDHNGQKIAFHWGNNTFSHAFTAIDLGNGDCVAIFANSVNGPNIFNLIAERVVGNMDPVFDLLSTYCGFNAVTPSKKVIAETQKFSFTPASQAVHGMPLLRWSCAFFKSSQPLSKQLITENSLEDKTQVAYGPGAIVPYKASKP